MKKFLKAIRRRRGLTLIELLVVVAIIGVLATIVFVSYDAAQAKSRDSRRITDLSSLKSAIEMYRELKGAYPGYDEYVETKDRGVSSNESLAEKLLPEGLLSTIPMDPLASTMSLEDGDPNDVYTGYQYFVYDFGTIFNASPTLPNPNRYGLFASLEKPSTTQSASVSGDYEKAVIDYYENKTSIYSGSITDGRKLNFALTN